MSSPRSKSALPQDDVIGVSAKLAYNLRDAADQLGVGVSSLYAMRKRNMIAFTAIAGRRVITHAELARVLAAAEAGDPAHRSGRIHDPISPTEEDRPEG